jgi:hypothetical protein
MQIGGCQPRRDTSARKLLRGLLWVDGLVDPHGLGQSGRLGWLADKPLRVGGVGAIQDGRPGGDDLAGTTVVDVGGG